MGKAGMVAVVELARYPSVFSHCLNLPSFQVTSTRILICFQIPYSCSLFWSSGLFCHSEWFKLHAGTLEVASHGSWGWNHDPKSIISGEWTRLFYLSSLLPFSSSPLLRFDLRRQ